MWRVKGEVEWLFHHIRADKMSLFTLPLISMHNGQSFNEYSYIIKLTVNCSFITAVLQGGLQGA